MYIPINPWGSYDPEDIPHLEVGDKVTKILKWILAFLIILLIALLVYANFFMFK